MNIRITGTIRATLVLWSALLCLPAVATTYYVDYVNGNDTNVGTSTAAPWQHCPGDGSRTGKVPASVNPGDVVLFNGGVTYGFAPGANDFINIANSGTSGSPITYRSGDRASPQWGTTPAYIECKNAGEVYFSQLGAIHIGNQSWITIDGLSMGNNTNVGVYTGLIGGYFHAGAGNITIQNCILTNSGASGIILLGLYDYGNNPAIFTISNCVVHDCNGHGIFFRGGFNNILVAGCNVYNTGEPLMGGTGMADDLAFFTYDLGNPACDNVAAIVISNNFFGSSITKSDIILEINANGIVVTGNTCYGTNETGVFDCNGSLTNVLFCNNLITNTVTTYQGVWKFIPTQAWTQDNGFKVLNNTVVSRQCNYGGVFYMMKGSATSATLFYNFTIENNIFTSVNNNTANPMIAVGLNVSSSAPVLDLATVICDYQVYNYNGTTTPFCLGSTSETLAQWQAATGQDAHSTTKVPAYVNAAAANYHLQSTDDVASGIGVNYSGLFQNDKDGTARSGSGPWSIGCYANNVSVPTAPIAPTGLHVVNP